jgi:cytochrome b pre-mRNA-processing protein 3
LVRRHCIEAGPPQYAPAPHRGKGGEISRRNPVVSILKRFFREDDRDALLPLYNAIVAEGREPAWYREGRVPDTLDGRFDMIAAVLALVLLRLEEVGEAGRAPSVHLTELFVDDMDGQLRQMGIGDIIVGKHIGKMMSALGGRLSAYREAFRPDGDLRSALARNLYRGEPPAEEALEFTAQRLRALDARIRAVPVKEQLKGQLTS